MSHAVLEQTPRVGESLKGYVGTPSAGTPSAGFTTRLSSSRVTSFGAITDLPELTRVSGRALTPIGNEITESQPQGFVHEAEEALDQVTAARDRRLELLVRQFEQASTPEDDARFHILTQRLRRLVPSVSPRAWDALNETTTCLEDISGNLDRLKMQFDLR